ncbi:MAG: hypothetical protein ACMUIP_13765 [bacterium]
MSVFEVISLGLLVINKLYPIARDIYDGVSDPEKPDVKADNAIDLIKEKAGKEGLYIGHTEAELVRSAIHFARAKSKRHPLFIEKNEDKRLAYLNRKGNTRCERE